MNKMNPYFGMPLTERCGRCGKEICDEEWVVNWAWCSSCLSGELEKYEQRRREHDRGESQ